MTQEVAEKNEAVNGVDGAPARKRGRPAGSKTKNRNASTGKSLDNKRKSVTRDRLIEQTLVLGTGSTSTSAPAPFGPVSFVEPGWDGKQDFSQFRAAALDKFQKVLDKYWEFIGATQLQVPALGR